MKKIFVLGVVLSVLFVAQSAFAMTFSQPVKLGSASAKDATFYVYEVKGATKNADGIAKFGNDKDAIYFYQRPATTKYCYGGEELNKTFPFTSAYGCEFTQIKTDGGITFYMVHEWEFDIRGEKYILLGKLSDGTWIKYFDTRDITKKYFGTLRGGYTDWHCNEGTFIISYKIYSPEAKGEFRFKWDEAAQWFGVEQVVY